MNRLNSLEFNFVSFIHISQLIELDAAQILVLTGTKSCASAIGSSY